MRVAALFSGGKDSTYALHWAVLHGFQVACLVTLEPERSDSWMFHRPAVWVTRLQARALGIPQVYEHTSGVRDRELEDLRRALARARDVYGAEGVVSGALLSDYQRLSIAVVAEELGLRTYTPLWRKRQDTYLRELVDHGFRILVTGLGAYGLPPWIVGKVLTPGDVDMIVERSRVYGFNPAFEGGEAETLVLDAPLFRMRLGVRGRRVVLGENEAVYVVEEAWLEEKHDSMKPPAFSRDSK